MDCTQKAIPVELSPAHKSHKASARMLSLQTGYPRHRHTSVERTRQAFQHCVETWLASQQHSVLLTSGSQRVAHFQGLEDVPMGATSKPVIDPAIPDLYVCRTSPARSSYSLDICDRLASATAICALVIRASISCMAKIKEHLGFESHHDSISMVVESARYLIENGMVDGLPL